MSQKILNRNQIGIRIQELRRHRMTELMTGNIQSCLACIVLHPFLNAPNRDRLPFAGSFIDQKNLLDLRSRAAFQIISEGVIGIVAHIHNPIFVPLALTNQDPSLSQVEVLEMQVRHFLHPQSTPQHQDEERPVPQPFQGTEKDLHLLVFQKARQRPGQAQSQSPFDRVGYLRSGFSVAEMIESPDAVQTAVNRLRG